MKILVAIANYGTKNRAFAEQLIATYREFRAQVDIVILSEAEKDFGTDVEVRVGLPSSNPWSLPFAHRALFAERKDHYDLFIYTEDDTEILERHVESFLEATEVLPKDHLAGFIRYELGPGGESYYSTVHAHYHWDVNSVFRVGDRVFARYTNDHSACYILTRDQLRRCIESGGFLVAPHEGEYDMLCAAATDPYTQCGFTKTICISHIGDFSLHHLPDIYLGRIGVDRPEIDRQIARLIEIEGTEEPRGPIAATRARAFGMVLDKRYFDDVRQDVLELVPKTARRILSVGCERGLTEGVLVSRGHQVTAVPLDCAIAESARMRGVAAALPDLDPARNGLAGERFDVVLFSDFLAYVADPPALLAQYAELLVPGGVVIAGFRNMRCLSVTKRKTKAQGISVLLRPAPRLAETGMHWTTPGLVSRWIEAAGLKRVSRSWEIDARFTKLSRSSLGLADPFLARTGAVLARK